jgi:predicted site-specific integrase-resolvase
MKSLENNAAIDEARCLRPAEYAKLKGFSTKTILDWCREGILPFIRVKNSFLIPLQRAEAALAKLEGSTQV